MQNLSNDNLNAAVQSDEPLLSDRVLGPVICDRDCIPIDCMVVADRDHPNWDHLIFERPWNISIDCMLDAIDFEPVDEIFNLKTSDDELDVALTDALIFFLRNLNSPKADACSLMVGSIKRFLNSHRDFKKYFEDLNDD